VPHAVSRALSRQDAFDALEGVEYVSSKPWIAKRDAALMALFYGCGLRLAEALSLKDLSFS
jgi:integrase/recombinase XerC